MPHIHNQPGQFDFAVEVFIVYKNKVLIREHDKYKIWLGVGGHIELDEDPNQTAKREVKEEVGLDIKLISVRPLPLNSEHDTELIPPVHLSKHAINKNHFHVALIYYARSNSYKVIPEKPDDKWEWLTKEEVKADKLKLQSNIKYYALEALELAKSKN